MFFAAKKQTRPHLEMALKANTQTELHRSETNQWFQQTGKGSETHQPLLPVAAPGLTWAGLLRKEWQVSPSSGGTPASEGRQEAAKATPRYWTRQTTLLSCSYQIFCQAAHKFQALFKASNRCRFKQTECAFGGKKLNKSLLWAECTFLKTSIFSSPSLYHILILFSINTSVIKATLVSA